MEFNQHIMTWYQNLKKVTIDDKADLEVMLLDQHHHTDALSAVLGVLSNLVQNGFRADLFELLSMAARPNNLLSVRTMAINGIVVVSILNDAKLRQCPDAIESILNILVEQQRIALASLITFNMSSKQLPTPFVNIRKTLIYRLVVVGEKANQAFDQSCC